MIIQKKYFLLLIFCSILIVSAEICYAASSQDKPPTLPPLNSDAPVMPGNIVRIPFTLSQVKSENYTQISPDGNKKLSVAPLVNDLTIKVKGEIPSIAIDNTLPLQNTTKGKIQINKLDNTNLPKLKLDLKGIPRTSPKPRAIKPSVK